MRLKDIFRALFIFFEFFTTKFSHSFCKKISACVSVLIGWSTFAFRFCPIWVPSMRNTLIPNARTRLAARTQRFEMRLCLLYFLKISFIGIC